MELGATELYFALQSAGEAGNLPQGLPHTNPLDYLQQAASLPITTSQMCTTQGPQTR